ncbi:DUF397 domain-containing protein [Streptomyces sp. Ag109_G2-15]|uniref:DUF397 domain-containing protein n=1 Tax=Streptomyces sp. Ag109_G2-15 TaxID=1938850 RepID=UPI000BCA7147|nr:DUF397 domain-containing protein [Streptomyces sp. Ag109_G2-15]SOD85503.1 protein of unknown function [Streptomyces sp. Ag109_G2-15]
MNPRWQKSSYCSEGASCIHISATSGTVHLTESSDPTATILTTTPAAFGAFIAVLKREPHRTTPIEATPIEVAFGEEGVVHLRGTSTPNTIVTTDRRKWNAFVLGIRAGEFDHFV